jgi:hypothetical protein
MINKRKESNKEMTFLQQKEKNNKENKEKKIDYVFEWAEYLLFNDANKKNIWFC